MSQTPTRRDPYYLSTLEASPPPLKLRLGSFNIRYSPSVPNPLKPFQSIYSRLNRGRGGTEEVGGGTKWGESKWQHRRDKLVDQVLFHELDIVGFQEVLNHQLDDLADLLGDEFGHVGVGRDDGKEGGEYVPIFYRKRTCSLVSVSHHWLSPTPSVPGSKGWDAGQPRMMTIARFKFDDPQRQGREQQEVWVGNTHWDDRGVEARTMSAKLILDIFRKQVEGDKQDGGGRNGKQEPLIVLLGDLNSPAEESGYQLLTGRRYLGAKDERNVEVYGKSFWDSRHEIATRKTSLGGPGALTRAYGPLNTFTGFVPSDEAKIIDFVLLFDTAAFVSPHVPRSDGPGTRASSSLVDTAFLDADDPDEVFASLPKPEPVASSPSSSGSTESLLSSDSPDSLQKRWKVSRYGVVPNFYEDVGGKRGSREDGIIVSDHRLVVVGLEQVVA